MNKKVNYEAYSNSKNFNGEMLMDSNKVKRTPQKFRTTTSIDHSLVRIAIEAERLEKRKLEIRNAAVKAMILAEQRKKAGESDKPVEMVSKEKKNVEEDIERSISYGPLVFSEREQYKRHKLRSRKLALIQKYAKNPQNKGASNQDTGKGDVPVVSDLKNASGISHGINKTLNEQDKKFPSKEIPQGMLKEISFESNGDSLRENTPLKVHYKPNGLHKVTEYCVKSSADFKKRYSVNELKSYK